jgi:PKD repeat protein
MKVTRTLSLLLVMLCIQAHAAGTTPQTINFSADSSEGNVVHLSATASSGLAVTYSIVSGPGLVVPTEFGADLCFSGSDPVVVQADQAGNATFAAATAVQNTFQARFATQAFIYSDTANNELSSYIYYPSLKPLAVDAAGNVYMVGSSVTDHTVGGQNKDIITTKFDKTGALVWVQKFDGAMHSDDGAYSILLNGSDVYVCGISINTGTKSDTTLLKYDTDGNLSTSWADTGAGVGVRIFRGSGTDNCDARLMAMAPNGDLIVCGETSNTATQDLFLMRLDSTGALSTAWPDQNDNVNKAGIRVYDGNGADVDEPFGMVLDSAGNVYVCGASRENHTTGGANTDGIVLKYAADGTRSWVHLYDSPATALDDYYYDIALDSVGNVLVTGYGGNSAAGDYVTTKLDSAGSVVWTTRFNDAKNKEDRAYSLVIDKDDSIFVTGYANWDNTSNDTVTLKYDKNGNQLMLLRLTAESAPSPASDFYKSGLKVLLDAKGYILVVSDTYDGNQGDFLLTKYSPSGELIFESRYNGSATNSYDPSFTMVLGADGAIYVGGITELSDGAGSKNSHMIALRISQNAPAVTSGPTATPNPATVGQAVNFSVAATDGATYTWNFGDGTSGTGASVTHTYSPAGTYTAKVTIDSNFGTTSSATVDVTVRPVGFGQTSVAIDSDGDGFSDELETALGTNANSAASTPFNGAAAGESSPIADTKLAIKLSFGKPNSDSIGLSGTIIMDSAAKLDGAFTLDVGGVVKTFTLANGAAKTAAGAVKVTAKGTGDRTAKFTVKLAKGSFASSLADEGLANTTVKTKDVTIGIAVLYNNTLFQTIKVQNYTAKQGSSGSTKDKK